MEEEAVVEVTLEVAGRVVLSTVTLVLPLLMFVGVAMLVPREVVSEEGLEVALVLAMPR